LRLTAKSYEAGLADKFRYDYTMRKYDSVERFNQFFTDAPVKPEYVNEYLKSVGSSEIDSRRRLADLISRPQVNINELYKLVPRGTFTKFNLNIEDEFVSPIADVLAEGRSYSDLIDYHKYNELNSDLSQKYSTDISFKDALYVLQYNTEYPVSKLYSASLDEIIKQNYEREILDSSEISIKYKGYIQRERQMADKIMRLENLTIPDDFDFDKVESLSIECRQKLKKYAPRTIAQASRISGVSPADISVLLVYFGR
jgi:tRNA U34 5-carboxymethylaminomethyl modifying enzyme MnmG/GidA